MAYYEEKVELLVEYFRAAECDRDERQLGIEIEHFLVEEDSLEAVSFFQQDGVEDLLKKLTENDWNPVMESGYVVGLESNSGTVTLEPGGQVELSIFPQVSIEDVEKIYLDFLEEVVSIVEQSNQSLLCLGYQPESSISDIPILPKKRYDHMYEYFEGKGKYAHNMMKGTAAIHVSYDFTDEEDFRKKNLVANVLAPLVYVALDNSPFFESEVYRNDGLRRTIWANCDENRCGYPEGVFLGGFGYRDYAEYLLHCPPMVYVNDGELVYSRDKLLKEILLEDLNPTREELEYVLTTVFPDVRLKDHLEIRMGDSLPHPYSVAYLAFWEGLLYDETNLESLYERYKDTTAEEFLSRSGAISKKGVKAPWNGDTVFSAYRELLEMAKEGLKGDEEGYLEPLITLADIGMTPKQKSLDSLAKGKREALAWCNLNKVVKD